MEPPRYDSARRTLSAADFDTASIRSAAPSYVSNAPTYRSVDPLSASSPSTVTSITTATSPYEPMVPRRVSEPTTPNLAHFRSSWSSIAANPTARHYHSVAQRRASKASAREAEQQRVAGLHPQSTAYKSLIERMEAAEAEEQTDPEALGLGKRGYRALEDAVLVGEEAAEQARLERLARENGNAILEREDRRWDWLLGQMKDWDERDRSWKKFREEVSDGRRGKLAKRLGLRSK